MSLKELYEKSMAIIADYLSQRITGKIVITINVKNGGIGNATISTEQQIEKR